MAVVNWALAANGGVVTASSETAGYPAASCNNGDRTGAPWGSGGGWSTPSTNPQWLQIEFTESKPVTEINVITIQDNYASPIEPTLAMTISTIYQPTAYNVEYWNGSAWVAVTGGNVTGNNKVWRQFTFPVINTNKIRVYVTTSGDNYARLVEVEAWGDDAILTNWALASNGGVASASSTYSGSAYHQPASVNDGNRTGAGWGTATNSGWNDGTNGVFPDWLQIDFGAERSISEIDVITIQDALGSSIEPTLAMTFASYGIIDYEVQYWNGTAWTTVTGGNVTGNNKVWRQFIFTPVTTDKIRVYITNAAGGYSRLIEVEAWGGALEEGGVSAWHELSASYVELTNGDAKYISGAQHQLTAVWQMASAGDWVEFIAPPTGATTYDMYKVEDTVTGNYIYFYPSGYFRNNTGSEDVYLGAILSVGDIIRWERISTGAYRFFRNGVLVRTSTTLLPNPTRASFTSDGDFVAGTTVIARPKSSFEPNITTASLVNGVMGDAYSVQLEVTGGVAPFNWVLLSGALPAGMTFSASGLLSGAPAVVGGPTALTFKVLDALGASDIQVLYLTIVVAPTVPPTYKGTFEIIPARKSLTLVRAVTRSGADAQLDFSVHKTKTIDVTGDPEPPEEPMMMMASFDGMSLQSEWTPSPTEAVSGYVITDEADRYIAQTSGERLTYAEPALADQVTRRIYAVSSSGVLSSGYAEYTWAMPAPTHIWNGVGVSLVPDTFRMTKTVTEGWGNAGIILDKKILDESVPVYLSGVPDRNTVEQVFGFTADNTPWDIADYTVAIHLKADGEAMWMFRGETGSLGQYVSGNEFTIELTPDKQDPLANADITFYRHLPEKAKGVRGKYKKISFSGHINQYVGVAIFTAGGVSDLNLKLYGNLAEYLSSTPISNASVPQGTLTKTAIIGKNKVMDIPKFTPVKTNLQNRVITAVFAELPIKAGSTLGGSFTAKIEAKDAVNVQVLTQIVRYEAINKAGVITSQIEVVYEGNLESSGQLKATWSITKGTDIINLCVNADSSLIVTSLIIEAVKHQI